MQDISDTTIQTVNMEQLRTFALVAQHGSFTAAADRLGLTQPAVSLQVRQLEKRLGVRLLERVGRAPKMTAAGMDLMAHIPFIASAVEAAVNAVAMHTVGVTGRVRIGTGGTTCLYFLPPILRRMRQAYPGLKIVICTGNTEYLLRRVEENTLDIALVTLPVHSRALTVTPLLEDELVAIGPKGETAMSRPLTPIVMSELPLLTFLKGATTRGIVDDWLRKGGASPKSMMEFDSVEAIKEMVAVGLGFSVLPNMALTGTGVHPGLQIRQLSPPLHRTLAMVMRDDKPVGRGLREVIDAIREGGSEVFNVPLEGARYGRSF